MQRFRICALSALALVLGLLPVRARATTVIAPDFDALVSQADYIVRAVVTSKTAEWRTDSSGRHIITKVTVTVREIIKGQPPSPLVLQLLGGRIGNAEMVVDGAPTFNVGDDDILFVHGNGRQFVPLVAVMYGQYLVMRDSVTGQELVHRSNGSVLYDTKDVAQPMTAATAAASASAQPLTATEFSIKIRQSAAQRLIPPPANAN